MKQAPIFIRAYDLYSWLLDRLGGEKCKSDIARNILEHSRVLLESLALALSRFDLGKRLVAADQRVVLLQIHLRLANEKKLLSDDQLCYATKELRDIGRQLGGWRKKEEKIG